MVLVVDAMWCDFGPVCQAMDSNPCVCSGWGSLISMGVTRQYMFICWIFWWVIVAVAVMVNVGGMIYNQLARTSTQHTREGVFADCKACISIWRVYCSMYYVVNSELSPSTSTNWIISLSSYSLVPACETLAGITCTFADCKVCPLLIT